MREFRGEFSGIGRGQPKTWPRRDSSTMSHGVTRRRESPEKEAARKEKEKGQIVEYRALAQDVLTRVPPSQTVPPNTQRNANDFSKEAFDLTTTLLKRN